ncbi:MAG: hypothetical protein WAX14_16395 [Rhodococcus sp. (in: high G+C Gram-positive bacteria)]|uniref:hypothetical protein n=1 Tax=Rhodococcus sp. TaxID=1831 RepID=UPI003BB717F6
MAAAEPGVVVAAVVTVVVVVVVLESSLLEHAVMNNGTAMSMRYAATERFT